MADPVTNHQRVGAISNAHAGREFEALAAAYYLGAEALQLSPDFPIELGVGPLKKAHRFDLGCHEPPVLVECKSHNFTVTGNIPSAKITVWNEAMYLFHLAPQGYRKILFVLEARHERQRETLATWYARNYGHLIPKGVEIVEYNIDTTAIWRVAP